MIFIQLESNFHLLSYSKIFSTSGISISIFIPKILYFEFVVIENPIFLFYLLHVKIDIQCYNKYQEVQVNTGTRFQTLCVH